MKPSSIGWADYSGGNLNFVTGCTPVSEGCANCYAAAIYKRWGKDFSKVTWSKEKLYKAIQYCWIPDGGPGFKRGANSRPLLFVCDTGDLFHPDVPNSFIAEALFYMARYKDVDWAVLTKRPERLAEMYKVIPPAKEFVSNIFMGVTAENQARADERIPILLEHWAGPTFVSVEPMLEPVNLWSVQFDKYTRMNVLQGCGLTTAPGIRGQSIPNCYCNKLDWVICGGESGPNRKTLNENWAADLYYQCQESGVPYFGKQTSGRFPGTPLLIDGKVIHEWPVSR